MELNPYTTPNAEIHAQPTSDRPVWVWAIFLYFAFAALSPLVALALIKYVLPELSGYMKQYLDSLAAMDYAISFLSKAIGFIAAIQLFRLRRNSFHLFMADILFGAVVIAWRVENVVTSGGMFSASGIVVVAFSYVLKIAICVYVWRLASTGVLK